MNREAASKTDLEENLEDQVRIAAEVKEEMQKLVAASLATAVKPMLNDFEIKIKTLLDVANKEVEDRIAKAHRDNKHVHMALDKIIKRQRSLTWSVVCLVGLAAVYISTILFGKLG